MTRLADDARALIRDVRRDRAQQLHVLIVLSVAGIMAEAVGILLLVPLLAFASGEFSLPDWAEVGWLMELAEPHRLAVVALLFLIAMALRTLLLWQRDRRQADTVIDYAASLRRRTLASLTQSRWSRTATPGESGMQERLIGQTGRVVFAASQALSIVVILALLVLQGLLALWLSPALTLFATALFALAMLVAAPILRQRHDAGKRINRSLAESSEESARLYQGLKAAIAEGDTARFLDRFHISDEKLVGHERALAHRQAGTSAVSSLAVAIGAVSLVLLGRLVLDLPITVLLPLLILFARLAAPARMLFSALDQFAAFAPSFAAFRDLPDNLDISPASDAPLIEWRRLDAQAVAFDHGDGFTLGPLDFAIARGEWVGIAGPTGSGKTSLVDLIAGLDSPSSGGFALDGRDVDLPQTPGWAAGIAYVGQVDRLLDGTLADNLGANRLDPGLLDAAGIADLVDEIGLDRPLGPRGARLSGGEAQRVAIARALHRRPNLIILDEATAALDTVSEAALMQRLKDISPRPTILMVAHRPQSLEAMDRVLQLGPSGVALTKD